MIIEWRHVCGAFRSVHNAKGLKAIVASRFLDHFAVPQDRKILLPVGFGSLCNATGLKTVIASWFMATLQCHRTDGNSCLSVLGHFGVPGDWQQLLPVSFGLLHNDNRLTAIVASQFWMDWRQLLPVGFGSLCSATGLKAVVASRFWVISQCQQTEGNCCQ